MLRYASSHSPVAVDIRRTGDSSATAPASFYLATDRQRRPVRRSVLLSARDVPAGTYRLRVFGEEAANGTLIVKAGDTSLPFLSIGAREAARHPDNYPIRIPIALRSLTVEGDETAAASALTLELVPTDPAARPSNASGLAHRAARYPGGAALFLDDNAYPEPTGFWVAGGRTAAIVAALSAGELELFVRNAAVENTVRIEFPVSTETLRLAPGEEQVVPIAAGGARDLIVRISSQSGFRPSQAEPGNRDLRYLGCWIELRPRS
jgi:hypothetical protein